LTGDELSGHCPMKILIAEDDLTSRNVLEAILTKWKYKVISTCDGKEAFDALQVKNAPQLAILDWEMPGMNGLDLCLKLREQQRRDLLYIILLTSRGESEDIIKGLEAGANDYVAKPYNHAILQARVNAGRRMVMLQNEMHKREKLQGVLEMAGAVCHELNQPVHCVSGFSEILLMDLDPNDPNYDTVKNIKENSDRIGDLTRKIMNITRYYSKPYLKSKIIDIDQASQ